MQQPTDELYRSPIGLALWCAAVLCLVGVLWSKWWLAGAAGFYIVECIRQYLMAKRLARLIADARRDAERRPS